jgi:hypothetical protein
LHRCAEAGGDLRDEFRDRRTGQAVAGPEHVHALRFRFGVTRLGMRCIHRDHQAQQKGQKLSVHFEQV